MAGADKVNIVLTGIEDTDYGCNKQMRIDMIFASEELVPLSSRVGTTHGESDHLPVLAEFGWR